jgi:hypothetical protein
VRGWPFIQLSEERSGSKKRGVHTAEVLHISITARKQVVDLTDQVEAVIRKAKMQEGLTTGEVGEGRSRIFFKWWNTDDSEHSLPACP